MKRLILVLLLFSEVAIGQKLPLDQAQGAEEIVATFSIVARDPVTQELGVAVQSRTFRAGAIVPFAKAKGVGAIATQAAAINPTDRVVWRCSKKEVSRRGRSETDQRRQRKRHSATRRDRC